MCRAHSIFFFRDGGAIMMLSHRESQAPLIVRPCVRISRPLPVLLSAAHPALAPFQHVAMSDEHLTPTVKWAQRKDALFLPETRAAFRRLERLGLYDALRLVRPGAGEYSFWDYQAGAWNRNDGIRIDHFLLTPTAADPSTERR